MSEWKMVKMYECPDCGELVRDMDEACNHTCKKLNDQKLNKFIEWLDARCKVAWGRATASEQFANRTPLWEEYVEETK